MTVAEREALMTETRRHDIVVAHLLDEEAMESLRVALDEEARGEEISYDELRSKHGRHS